MPDFGATQGNLLGYGAIGVAVVIAWLILSKMPKQTTVVGYGMTLVLVGGLAVFAMLLADRAQPSLDKANATIRNCRTELRQVNRLATVQMGRADTLPAARGVAADIRSTVRRSKCLR